MLKASATSGVVEHAKVTLADAFGQPVPAHIFHAKITSLNSEPKTMFGIMEAWRPPKPSKNAAQHCPQKRGSGTAPQASVQDFGDIPCHPRRASVNSTLTSSPTYDQSPLCLVRQRPA